MNIIPLKEQPQWQAGEKQLIEIQAAINQKQQELKALQSIPKAEQLKNIMQGLSGDNSIQIQQLRSDIKILEEAYNSKRAALHGEIKNQLSRQVCEDQQAEHKTLCEGILKNMAGLHQAIVDERFFRDTIKENGYDSCLRDINPALYHRSPEKYKEQLMVYVFGSKELTGEQFKGDLWAIDCNFANAEKAALPK